MKIRMKTRYANGTLAIEPDQVGEVPDAEAKELIRKGFAFPVDQDPSHGGKPARKPTRRQPTPKGGQPPAGDTPDAGAAEEPDGDGDGGEDDQT